MWICLRCILCATKWAHIRSLTWFSHALLIVRCRRIEIFYLFILHSHWLTISSFWMWLALFARRCSENVIFHMCAFFVYNFFSRFIAVRNIRIWMHFLPLWWAYQIMLVHDWHKAGIKYHQNSKNYSWSSRLLSIQAEIIVHTGKQSYFKFVVWLNELGERIYTIHAYAISLNLVTLRFIFIAWYSPE